ncbi:hypothetical protein [Bacillus cereus group sp. BfR-BA-00999]|uniref:hypothetical protein n=1 Tax=Bacillus cereus group sp. BfR-BA-00999 TaxID=3094871 RepID=UPI0029C110F2|nr:hypothetical protein [Bacillus cereus group sp. BfR-BA-00999]MDX5884888.1 hypothetical protein [Bacillus cereus group sp. BfR-BA-00999]
MSFSSTFRTRMNAKGGTNYDRVFKGAVRDFEIWFNSHVGRETILVDGIEQYAVFQDQNQNNNKDLSDDKYMIVKNDSHAQVGSYVNWRGNIWMIFSDEHKTIPTHKQLKVKEANHVIKWMIGDKICGNGHGYDAYVQNQTLYTLGVSTSGQNAWIVNGKMMMYMQDNAETRAIKIGQRIFIGGAVYQVFFKDPVSRKGLINYLLEQDMFAVDRDNAELGIADYYPAKKPDPTEPPVNPTEVVITGADKAKVGSLVKYVASEDIVEWTVSDTEAVAKVVEQDSRNISIRIESNFQKVGSIITIVGKTASGSIGSKTVKIVSPY